MSTKLSKRGPNGAKIKKIRFVVTKSLHDTVMRKVRSPMHNMPHPVAFPCLS